MRRSKNGSLSPKADLFHEWDTVKAKFSLPTNLETHSALDKASERLAQRAQSQAPPFFERLSSAEQRMTSRHVEMKHDVTPSPPLVVDSRAPLQHRRERAQARVADVTLQNPEPSEQVVQPLYHRVRRTLPFRSVPFRRSVPLRSAGRELGEEGLEGGLRFFVAGGRAEADHDVSSVVEQAEEVGKVDGGVALQNLRKGLRPG